MNPSTQNEFARGAKREAFPEPLLLPATDFGRSLILSGGADHGNAPVFWVESRCRIQGPDAEVLLDYYQCGSCKSEDTFAPENLFLQPNYNFLPVFSRDHAVVFRRYASATSGERPYRSVVEPPWGEVRPRIRTVPTRVLADGAAIAAAAAAAWPLIGQVSVEEPESGYRAILEFPIKTMNVGTDGTRWQVDTGPVVLPDLEAPRARWPETLRLAFIAYNAWDWADFVVETPTSRTSGGRGEGQVHHYSEVLHRETRNRLLAVDLSESEGP